MNDRHNKAQTLAQTSTARYSLTGSRWEDGDTMPSSRATRTTRASWSFNRNPALRDWSFKNNTAPPEWCLHVVALPEKHTFILPDGSTLGEEADGSAEIVPAPGPDTDTTDTQFALSDTWARKSLDAPPYTPEELDKGSTCCVTVSRPRTSSNPDLFGVCMIQGALAVLDGLVLDMTDYTAEPGSVFKVRSVHGTDACLAQFGKTHTATCDEGGKLCLTVNASNSKRLSAGSEHAA